MDWRVEYLFSREKMWTSEAKPSTSDLLHPITLLMPWYLISCHGFRSP